MSLGAREVEGCQASVVPLVDLHSGLHQILHHRTRSIGTGDVQRRLAPLLRREGRGRHEKRAKKAMGEREGGAHRIHSKFVGLKRLNEELDSVQMAEGDRNMERGVAVLRWNQGEREARRGRGREGTRSRTSTEIQCLYSVRRSWMTR